MAASSANETVATIEYAVGDDVLVTQPDKRFFLGCIKKFDADRRNALIYYNDGTSRWAEMKDVALFSLSRELHTEVGQKRKRKFRFLYDVSVLRWNEQKTANAEEEYCYCGEPRLVIPVPFFVQTTVP